MKHISEHIDNIEIFSNILKNGAGFYDIELEDDSIKKFFRYFNEIKKWNKRINLTGLKDDRCIVERLFIDSIFVKKILKGDEWLLDIGTGAGVPGIPLKILHPELSCTLVDSSAKKVSFLKNVIRELELKKTDAIFLRLEYKKGNLLNRFFDAVVMKAFASTVRCMQEGGTYLKRGGRLILMKSGGDGVQLDTDGLQPGKETVFLQESVYELPFSKIQRKLLVWQKL